MAILLVAAMTLFATIAAGTAQTRADPEPRTTVVPYTPPEPCCEPGQNYDSAADREVRNPAAGWGGEPGWLLLILSVAAIFFLIGRYTAPPAPGDVLKEINKVFEEQKRLGKVYNWDKLDPVLNEASAAVPGALRKFKVVP